MTLQCAPLGLLAALIALKEFVGTAIALPDIRPGFFEAQLIEGLRTGTGTFQGEPHMSRLRGGEERISAWRIQRGSSELDLMIIPMHSTTPSRWSQRAAQLQHRLEILAAHLESGAKNVE